MVRTNTINRDFFSVFTVSVWNAWEVGSITTLKFESAHDIKKTERTLFTRTWIGQRPDHSHSHSHKVLLRNDPQNSPSQSPTEPGAKLGFGIGPRLSVSNCTP